MPGPGTLPQPWLYSGTFCSPLRLTSTHPYFSTMTALVSFLPMSTSSVLKSVRYMMELLNKIFKKTFIYILSVYASFVCMYVCLPEDGIGFHYRQWRTAL